MRAIWAFEALNPDELNLAVGDIITLTDDTNPEW